MLLALGTPALPVTLAYQKGWNEASAHGRTLGYPAHAIYTSVVPNRTDDFTAGWNAAVSYGLKFGHSPPM